MSLSLADLITPLTEEQAKAKLYGYLDGLGLATTAWRAGSPTRTLLAVFARAYASFSELSAAATRGGFLDLATGGWLTLCARYVYAVERLAPSFAAGALTATNPTGFLYEGGPGDLIATNPATGKTYRNTAAFSIGPAGMMGPTVVAIPFAAVEAGAAGTSGGGTITTLTTPLAGVTITNVLTFVGDDEEADEALRVRCREKIATLSPNGPRDAYAYVAKSATLNGAPIRVTRVRTKADGFFGIDVYLATAAGNVEGPVENPATALGAIDAAIQAQVVPEGVTARTHSATPKPVAVTYELWVQRTAQTDEQIVAAVRAQLIAWFGGQPIGGFDILRIPGVWSGKVYRSAIETAIGQTVGLSVVRVVVSTPTLDVALSIHEAPALGTITPTIHQVDQEVL